MASEATTQFTRVEFSDLSHHGDNLGAALDVSQAALLPRNVSNSASSSVLSDGEIAITESSVTSAVIAFRSGNTTYQFIADSASVL